MNSFNAKKIGFWIGLAIFVCIYFMPVPDGLSNEGKLTAAIFLLMGIWWATEAATLCNGSIAFNFLSFVRNRSNWSYQ